MVEKTLGKLNKCILPQWKVCFFSALIVGMVAHMYKLTNWLPNWDSLVFRYDSQNMLALGRWFLSVACAFSSFYDLPFLNGMLAIVFHAVGAVCVCKVVNVQKNLTAFLTGAVVVSFPTVVSVLMYNYVADGYALAFLMACAAAVLLTEKKMHYIAGTLLITLSVATYQAYITVTIMLLLLNLIDDLIFGKKEFQVILIKALRFMAVGIAGMVLYYVILNVMIRLSGVELLEYQGLSSAGGGGVDLASSLYVMKETFIGCFFDFSHGINVYAVVNAVIMVLMVVMYGLYILKNKVFLSPLKFLMLLVCVIFLGVAPAVLSLINHDIDYHNLMRMGYCILYIFFIILYERGQEHTGRHSDFMNLAVPVLSLILIFSQIVVANVSWHKAQMAYEKSYAMLIRISDRIESLEEARSCDEILVIGELEDSEAYSAVVPPDITGITDGYIIRADDEIVGQSVLCSALNDYCGKDFGFVSGERKKEFLKKDEVKNMKVWPLDGSVDVVDDIIVIKFD